jgi:hypothetical protein
VELGSAGGSAVALKWIARLCAVTLRVAAGAVVGLGQTAPCASEVSARRNAPERVPEERIIATRAAATRTKTLDEAAT